MSPAANIGIYARPYKPGSNKFLSLLDSGVGKTIERIECSASPTEWYQRLLYAGGSSTVEWIAGVSQWDSFYH